MSESLIKNSEWNLVFEYSEWLDSDKHLLTPAEGDEATHEDLVDEFFKQREEEEE